MCDNSSVGEIAGLQQEEIDAAVRSIEGMRDDKGLMLAWQMSTGAIGFFYLARVGKRLAIISASAKHRSAPFECDATSRYDHAGVLYPHYVDALQEAAIATGVPHTELVQHLASSRNLWRFQGFIDGKPDSRWSDNSVVWRVLWGRLIEVSEKLLKPLPHDIRQEVGHKLLFFATEGQVTLLR